MRKTTTIICALSAAILALCMTACIRGGGQPDPVDPTPQPDPSPTYSLTVSQDYYYAGIYKDPFNGETTFTYVLPSLQGADTDYVAQINAFIADLRTNYVEPSVEAIQKGDALGYNSVTYEAQPVEDMISLMFSWSSLYDGDVQFKTFLIKADGTMAENKELFAAKGVTEQQVLAKVTEQLGTLVPKPDYAAIEAAAGKSMADMAQAAYDKTFAADNINGHMPYYVNDEGHLAVVATVYTVAGAGHKSYVLDLGY